MKFGKRLLLVCILLSLSACNTQLGRQIGLGEPTDAEINAVAGKAYSDIKAKAKLSKNKRLSDMVQKVSMRVARASGENFDWEVMLIEDEQLNAWCMPGGKMAVYTGILPVLETEGALAAVMGHEVAHATRRHGKQRYARAVRGQMVGLGIGLATIVGGQLLCESEQCKILTGLTGVAAGFAITFLDRRFSREDEIEADRVGQIYMAKAGYDPSEAARVWQRMARVSGRAPPEFLSTHPASSRRENNLNQWATQAQRYYEQAPVKYGIGERI